MFQKECSYRRRKGLGVCFSLAQCVWAIKNIFAIYDDLPDLQGRLWVCGLHKDSILQLSPKKLVH